MLNDLKFRSKDLLISGQHAATHSLITLVSIFIILLMNIIEILCVCIGTLPDTRPSSVSSLVDGIEIDSQCHS